MERVDGKAAGDYSFITCQRIGLQMERVPTPYPTRRAVRARRIEMQRLGIEELIIDIHSLHCCLHCCLHCSG